MQGFKSWLVSQGYRTRTISEHVRLAGLWLGWLDGRAATRAAAVAYLEQRRRSGVCSSTLRYDLRAMQLYYRWSGGADPTSGMKIRSGRPALRQWLTGEERGALYDRYRGREHATPLRITVAGLMLYQGLLSGDLATLDIEAIDVRAAVVRVPERYRSARRTLKLAAEQIADIAAYIESRHTAGKPLFQRSIDNVVTNVTRVLREYDSRITSAHDIRASVIAGWIASEGLRQAQYRAGHHKVGSTERYKRIDTAELRAEVERYHPLMEG